MKAAKAVYATIATFILSCTTAIAALPEGQHSFGNLDTVAWLTIIGSTLAVGAGVYGITNTPSD